MWIMGTKRTSLALNRQLLEEAYAQTVDRALGEFVRRMKSRQILSLAGSGLWQGDLTAMRGDSPRRRRGPR
jgi:hypothetical protein